MTEIYYYQERSVRGRRTSSSVMGLSTWCTDAWPCSMQTKTKVSPSQWSKGMDGFTFTRTTRASRATEIRKQQEVTPTEINRDLRCSQERRGNEIEQRKQNHLTRVQEKTVRYSELRLLLLSLERIGINDILSENNQLISIR